MLIKSINNKINQIIKSDFISTDEDPGLRIESFAIIKLRGVSTKLNIIFFHHANFQEISYVIVYDLNRKESWDSVVLKFG